MDEVQRDLNDVVFIPQGDGIRGDVTDEGGAAVTDLLRHEAYSLGGSELQIHRAGSTTFWVGEGPQIRDDGGDTIHAISDVDEDFIEGGGRFGRKVFALLAQNKNGRFNEVQRIVDLVNNAGAQAANGSKFFALGELGFGLFQSLQGRDEFLITVAQLLALSLNLAAVNKLTETYGMMLAAAIRLREFVNR